MVNITCEGERLLVEVQGLDKLWAFKSKIEVDLANIRAVAADPLATKGIFKGMRSPGTHIPNLIVAGTYYRDGECHFWDVKNGAKTVVIRLENESYDRLFVEVEDPAVTVEMIQAAIPVEGG